MSADDFLPLLVFCIIRAQPPKPRANIHFMRKLRREDALCGEADYHLTAYQSAFDFIENMEVPCRVPQSTNTETTRASAFDTREVSPPPRPRLGSDHSSLQGLLYEDIKDTLRFHNVSYSALFACDVKELLKEYHHVLHNYAQLSLKVTHGRTRRSPSLN